MHLYEIDKAIAQLLDKLDYDHDQGMEITEEQLKRDIDELNLKRDEKLENCCKYLKGLYRFGEGLEAEIQQLKRKVELNNNRAAWLEKYITASVGPGNYMTVGAIDIRWRKSSAVEVRDEYLIPDQFWRTKVIREIAKADIKDHIKGGGEPIPGVEVVNRLNLVVK